MRLLRRLTTAVTTALALAVAPGLGGVQPATALTPGPVVAQLNMCGTECPGAWATKVDWIASTVAARGVSALSLNEVCGGQLTQLVNRLRARGYAMYAQFVATVPTGTSKCAGTGYGNAVLTRAAPLSVRRLTFAAQDGGSQRRAVMCVVVPLGKQAQVCTTHLSPGPKRYAVRDRQVGEAVAFVRRYSGPSLLMGDLNDYPASNTLDRVYAAAYGAGAYGAFVEGGSTRAGQPCRCGAPTRGTVKIDYVFALAASFGAGSSQTIDDPYSDHHLLLARPDWR